MRVYERVWWPLAQRLDPEASHRLVLRLGSAAQGVPPARWVTSRVFTQRDPGLAVTWRGLTFPNPVGLAAGADKDARAPLFFQALGFGFIEIGTVTPEPQPGNPRPRVFRLPARQAMVNRLGFPSQGAERVAERLRGLRLRVPLGVNIGKNSATLLGQAARDYLRCLEALYPFGDYFVVNVSSPNTVGLTSLQAKPALKALLDPVIERRSALAASAGGPPKPLLVKLSSDLRGAELDDALGVAVEEGADGVIAVNTSTDPAIKRDAGGIPGGISGAPLRERALETVRYIRRHAPEGFCIIGVGGVFDHRDAWALLRAGANLVQLYTGLVYRGPGTVKSINRGLLALMEKEGVPKLDNLGAYHGAIAPDAQPGPRQSSISQH